MGRSSPKITCVCVYIYIGTLKFHWKMREFYIIKKGKKKSIKHIQYRKIIRRPTSFQNPPYQLSIKFKLIPSAPSFTKVSAILWPLPADMSVEPIIFQHKRLRTILTYPSSRNTKKWSQNNLGNVICIFPMWGFCQSLLK